ncbi:MAG: tetratricopeptide repeat protein [candidate division WOR-3 bacterium]|nr:tetratricopeptide repeat protein [candidate division WOR-3 bacterium]
MPVEDPEAGKFLKQASVALKKGKVDAALKSAIQGLECDPEEKEGAELNRIAAEACRRKGQLGRALSYAEVGREHAHRSEDYRLSYNSAVTLGNIYAHMNNYEAADMAWSEALTMAGMYGDTRLEGLVLLNMAKLDQRRGNYVRALDALKKVRARFEKVNERRLLAVCYGHMAVSFMEAEQVGNAIRSSKKIEDLANRLGDKNLKAIAHFRRGSIHLKQDEFPNALPELQKASELYREVGDVTNLAMVLCQLATVYRHLGEFDKVELLLKEAAELAEDIPSPVLTHAITLTTAETAAWKGEKETAAQGYRKAFDLAAEINSADRFQSLHESLRSTISKVGLDLPGLRHLLKRANESYLRLGLKREAEETQRWLSEIPLSD